MAALNLAHPKMLKLSPGATGTVAAGKMLKVKEINKSNNKGSVGFVGNN